MEIEFELMEEDYINFNIDHANKSPAVKRSLLFQRVLGPVMFLIAPFIIARFSQIPTWYWFSVFSINSIIWIVFYPKYFNWEMKRKMMKMFKEGSNANLLKPRKITLTDNGLVEKSASGETNIEWNEVEKIDQTNEYIYIYNSSVSAYIIPKRIFASEGVMETFLAEVLSFYNM